MTAGPAVITTQVLDRRVESDPLITQHIDCSGTTLGGKDDRVLCVHFSTDLPETSDESS